MQAHWLEGDRSPLSVEDLTREGIPFEHLPAEADGYQPALDRVKAERGYRTQDEVALDPNTPNLSAICAKFVDEHLHTEDEVRFVLEGEGVFDIRTRDDRWMRVKVEQGDLIVVPENRYHRFMLTDTRTIRCVRLFKNESGWTPHYRKESAV